MKDAVNMEDLICLLATVRTLKVRNCCLLSAENNDNRHVLPNKSSPGRLAFAQDTCSYLYLTDFYAICSLGVYVGAGPHG